MDRLPRWLPALGVAAVAALLLVFWPRRPADDAAPPATPTPRPRPAPVSHGPLFDPVEEAVTDVEVALDDLRTAVENLVPDQAAALFAPGFRGDTPFDPFAPDPSSRIEPIDVDVFDSPPPCTIPVAERLRSFVTAWEVVEECAVRIPEAAMAGDGSLHARTLWTIRGRRSGARAEVVEDFRTRFERSGSAWRIASMERVSGRMLVRAAPLFRDVTAAAGFRIPRGIPCLEPPGDVPEESCHGCTYRAPYLLAGGVAVADLDGDDLPDLFVARPGGNRLLRNVDGLRFEDITRRAGVGRGGSHTGALAWDFDNDGDLDLLSTSLAPEGDDDSAVVLYRNDGESFADVTEAAGLTRHGLATSAAAADVDRDGDLDLYVGFTGGATGAPIGTDRPPVPDAFFRNFGDGTFREEAAAAGLADGRWTLGVLMADLDGDGWTDVSAVHDGGPATLHLNVEGREFRDVPGGAEFGAGAALFDADDDGLLDLHVSGWHSDAAGRVLGDPGGDALLRNLGGGRFEDVAAAAGVRDAGRAWGAVALDAMNRGAVDLFVANGLRTGALRADETARFWREQPARASDEEGRSRLAGNMLIEGTGPHLETLSFAGGEADAFFFRIEPGRFVDLAGVAGLARVEDGRGVVGADLDRDGDVDLVVRNAWENPLLILRNENPSGNHSLLVQLEGADCNRRGVGAVVRIEAGGRSQVRPILCGDSYLSCGPPEAHFGLGEAAQADAVEVLWPCGRRERVGPIPAGGIVLVREGGGIAGRREYRVQPEAPPSDPPSTVRVGEVVQLELTGFDGLPQRIPGPHGRAALLHFWSAGPIACGTDVPHYNDMKDALAGVPLDLFSINVDDDLDAVRRGLEQLPPGTPPLIGWPVRDRFVHLVRPIVPVSFLLDAQGRVLAKHVGAMGPDGTAAWVRAHLPGAGER